MDVSRTRALRGPNLWSRHMAIEAVVTCAENERAVGQMAGFEPRLRALFPAIGVLHPEIARRIDKKRAAVVFALELDALAPAVVPAYRAYSKFPSIRRDLALVVDMEVSADALTKAARAALGELLQEAIVFDVYRGKGVDSRRKSIGLGLILQDASRTLTDEDADQKMRSVMQKLERELGIER